MIALSVIKVGGCGLKNPVKEKLKTGKPSVGTWVTIGHPDVPERLAALGFDWIIFDTEHSPMDVPSIQTLMQAMSYTRECVPFIRVAWNDMVLVKRALDIGAYGLVIPWVNTREEALNAVRYCRYPPEGVRGFGPRRAAMFDPDYVKTANDEILLVVQIETEKALSNLDEILSVEGIDACFIGPYDLSMSLGAFTQWNNPKFMDAVDKVLKTSLKWGVAPGMHCDNEDIVNEAITRGFRFCALSGDEGFLRRGALEAIKKVEGWTH